MVQRGWRSGYTNYSVNEQMLLCSIAEKILPVGRNMWEEVAALYNSKRSRSSMERDYDSLRRKFKNLYTTKKPTGINGDIPPKLRPVLYAQEIQVAIGKKGGSRTYSDSQDAGQDDSSLLRDVDDALGTDSNGEAQRELDDVPDSECDPEDEADSDANFSQNTSETFSAGHVAREQYTRLAEETDQTLAVGSVITSRGTFDASLAEEVWSSDEAVCDGGETCDGGEACEGGEANDEQMGNVYEEKQTSAQVGNSQELEADGGDSGAEDDSRHSDVQPRVIPAISTDTLGSLTSASTSTHVTPPATTSGETITHPTKARSQLPGQSPRTPGPSQTSTNKQRKTSATKRKAEHPPPNTRNLNEASFIRPPSVSGWDGAAEQRAAGRQRKPNRQPKATYAHPDGPPLDRNPARAKDNTREGDRYKKLGEVNSRLGGADLRVLRDNMETLNPHQEDKNRQRESSDKSTTGSIFFANKRQKAKARMAQLAKEVSETEGKKDEGSSEMMSMLMFYRQDQAARAENEERRRREDREERERVRREEAVASEARLQMQMELARQDRDHQQKHDAEEAAENRRRYEERVERDRQDSKQRHEEMMMLFAAMQQGMQGRGATFKDST